MQQLLTTHATEINVPGTIQTFVAKIMNVIMRDIELYTTDDMCRIFKIPRSSLYRKLREAREGHGGLPLPLPSKKQGHHLRWNAESVRAFCAAQCETVQPIPTPFTTTEAERKKKYSTAYDELTEMGVKLDPEQ